MIKVILIMRLFSTVVGTIILFFILLTQHGCSNDTETTTSSAMNHTQQGWFAYTSGDYSQALLSFERALNIDPEFADAHNGVGWSHMSLSLNLTLTQEAFQNALRYDAANADAWVGLANVLYLRYKDPSDFNAAIRAIENALKTGQNYLYRHDYQSNAELYTLKGLCHFYLGETELAQEEIDKALQIDADNKTVVVLQNMLKK